MTPNLGTDNTLQHDDVDVVHHSSPTCRLAEFSSKWRTAFSHLRGGSYNRTVVHEFPRREDRGAEESVGCAARHTDASLRCGSAWAPGYRDVRDVRRTSAMSQYCDGIF